MKASVKASEAGCCQQHSWENPPPVLLPQMRDTDILLLELFPRHQGRTFALFRAIPTQYTNPAQSCRTSYQGCRSNCGPCRRAVRRARSVLPIGPRCGVSTDASALRSCWDRATCALRRRRWTGCFAGLARKGQKRITVLSAQSAVSRAAATKSKGNAQLVEGDLSPRSG